MFPIGKECLMNKKLLKNIICPSCKNDFELVQSINEHEAKLQFGGNLSDQEIITGILKCKCGNIFPVIEGVPRLLEGGIFRFPEFIKKFSGQINTICGTEITGNSLLSNDIEEDDYENIRKSFSQEWGIFDYNEDKTWGWSIEERKKIFLDDINLQPQELVGKRLLDAGCGNGSLTAALSDFGLEMVGLDLNDGLGIAYLNRAKFGKKAIECVQFIQGNIIKPPFKEETYDIVYSSGVIHHTPSSKGAFESLSHMVKKNGRLYVWVYGKRAFPIRLFFAIGHNFKRFISLKSLMKVCVFSAPLYKILADIMNKFNFIQFRPRTVREITLDLFDSFAPRYNHWHTAGEVRSWFEEFGFQNIKISGCQKHGFGMFGDRI
jgi:SAM-dependent methyltransferase/uncharacterized protein YbaR (Trm112 family)